ncbi:ABC transporter type 1, transmembrane domain-containing protein [Immersiella caudata]|uniref:ABC transporter type 1, transmembrane domain-containing protein n=1 Tax=Immersiella caudata TaxID=314043 RepID=A0AA39XGN0_9PEZI|nr:ABC transporter type 1, transmembrane domain-containing protein [Immersiella caudata]
MDDTIRYNITGSDPAFDQKWYSFSVESSGLEGNISRMMHRDAAKCGSNGSALSGGPEAEGVFPGVDRLLMRQALARAIYSTLPVVVFDDVTSGLDSKAVTLVMTRLFGSEGYFRQGGVSVVMATHSRRIIPNMDRIIVLDGGEVADEGSYEEILQRSASLVEQTEEDFGAGEGPSDIGIEKQAGPKKNDGSGPQRGFRSPVEPHQGVWQLGGLQIGRWTGANEQSPNQQLGFYLGVYAVFVVLANIGPFLECRIFFIRVINNTALKLHADLLEATLRTEVFDVTNWYRAPFSFFQRTDTGTITNRFSQDMDLIDTTLPMQAIQFTTGAASCLVQLIIICVVGKYLAAAIPVLATTVFVVQRYYLRTSRQVRLLDIEVKAP